MVKEIRFLFQQSSMVSRQLNKAKTDNLILKKKLKDLRSEILVLRVERAKGWCTEKSEILDIMACEKHLLNFIQKWVERMDEVKSIKQYTLYDFRAEVQQIKDRLLEEEEAKKKK
jgi:hypothetical protein